MTSKDKNYLLSMMSYSCILNTFEASLSLGLIICTKSWNTQKKIHQEIAQKYDIDFYTLQSLPNFTSCEGDQELREKK